MATYDLPSWLNPAPMGSPGESLARGVSSGSQIAHNFLASAQSAREDALMPLRMQQMQMQTQSAALDIHAKQEAQADMLANKAAFSKLATASAEISSRGAWSDPRSAQAIWQVAAENPSVVSTPAFQNAVKNFDISEMAKVKAEEARAKLYDAETSGLTGNSGGPQISTQNNAATGLDESFYRTPKGWSRIPENIGVRQNATFSQQDKMAMLKFALAQAPELVQFNQQGQPFLPQENFQEAAKRAGIPTAIKTDLAKQELGTESVFRNGRALMALITPETVGPTGFKNRLLARDPTGIGAKVLGVDPVNMNDAVASETAARTFLAGVFKSFRSDSNINKDEVAKLESAAPDPTRFFTQPNVEKAKLLQILRSAFETSRSTASHLGKEITPMFLTREELAMQVQNQRISPDEAIKIWNNGASSLIEDLNKELVYGRK